MMPTRRRTRDHDRATRITTERAHNRHTRGAPEKPNYWKTTDTETGTDPDPPPF